MDLYYKSTRGMKEKVTASKAVLQGLAEDGGLFVPERIPKLTIPLEELSAMDYKETAYEVMRLFFTDFTEEELKQCILNAYDSKFDTEEIVPIVKAENDYYMELFHGATIAFKDLALSILPHLLTTAARKHQIENEIVILTATSGDTGKAALNGFSDVKGTRIIVFYPKDGVSEVQKLQMITQKGENTSVIAIHGNFDQAQTGVKQIFEDQEFAKKLRKDGFQFSSANSINIGRLVPQIVYYVYTYAKLYAYGEIEKGEKINVTVPTGNFGNILAAYYAKKMGIPIDHLICASNDNKVLYDFFETGIYDKNRKFMVTTSPSMDILVSSNLERLLYHSCEENTEKVRKCMENLKKQGVYSVTDEMRKSMDSFHAEFTTEKEAAWQIRKIYEQNGYVIDPHTAVASFAAKKYKEKTKDRKKMVIVSTASPYKFTGAVLTAIDKNFERKNEISLADQLNRFSGVAVPNAIREIKSAEILHKKECEVKDMKKMVGQILNIGQNI